MRVAHLISNLCTCSESDALQSTRLVVISTIHIATEELYRLQVDRKEHAGCRVAGGRVGDGVAPPK